MSKGIDVSTWQGIINWDAVKATGIEFAIIRAGYGKNTIDKQFKRNISECNRLGIPCGVYWFSYALSAAEARQEAEACIAVIKPYELQYPIVYDLEYDTIRYAKQNGVTIGKALATAMATAFCSRVEELGYYASNYCNADYAANMFDMAALSKFDLWYAWYNSTCNRNDAGLWQYTSSGKVSGISGNVDMNIANKDYTSIIRNAGLNEFKKSSAEPLPDKSTPTPKPTPAPEQSTYTVQSGDSLWAIAQKLMGDGNLYREIKVLNGLTSDTIHPNQVLKIPGGSGVINNTRSYTVNSGDSLWAIAQEQLGNGSRYGEIKALNGLTGDTIHPGQVLKLPD